MGSSLSAGNSSGRQSTEAAHHRLTGILESSDDEIIGQDIDGIITDWNPSAEKIFGYLASDVIGTPRKRLMPADRQEEADYILGRIKRGEGLKQFGTRQQTKDGRLLNVLLTVIP